MSNIIDEEFAKIMSNFSNDLEFNRFAKIAELAKIQDVGSYGIPSSDLSSIESILRSEFESERVIHPLERDPNWVAPRMSIEFSDAEPYLKTAGRISNIRKSGKICFIKINDGLHYIQLIVSAGNYSGYANLGNFDLGDIVEVCGQAVYSKTYEPSILVKDLTMLTKAITPPPEKYAGIAEQSAASMRHVDLMSNLDSKIIFTIRAYVLRAIRQFLDTQDFVEVETPTLASNANGAAAKPFETYHNAYDRNLFLRISPELYLKKLLVGGMPKVYELGKNFRNEGVSNRHNPEFTMLEFYEAYGTFPKLISYTQKLIEFVDSYLSTRLPRPAQLAYAEMQKNRSWSHIQFEVVTLKQAVLNAASKLSVELTDEYFVNSDVAYASEINALSSRGERLLALFEQIAEPRLTIDYRSSCGKYSLPVFVTEYPAEVCPLARTSDENEGICDRFELFVNNQELANAYQELNDPFKQKENFLEQSEASHKEYDKSYIEALKCGMPPAIGFGMGVDRLVMMLTGVNSIKNVILFPNQ